MSRSSSSASTSSASSSDSSESSSDSSSSSASSSASTSSSANSSGKAARGRPSTAKQPRPTGGGGGGAAAAVGGCLSTSEDLPPIHSNPSLTFARPDDELIGIDAKDMRCISQIVNWPWGQHRAVDYFRAAVRLFVVTLRNDYNACLTRAVQAGRKDVRFVWQNRGVISEHFAMLCDAAKVLYDKLKSKGVFTVFMDWVILHLFVVSKVPREVLGEKTYTVKRKDWEKGGTRYKASDGDSASSNVLFAQVSVRRQKIEEYLRAQLVAEAPTHVIVPIATAPAAPAAAKLKMKSAPANPAPGAPTQQMMVALPGGGPAPRNGIRTVYRTAQQLAERSLKHRAQLIVGDSSIRYPLTARASMPQFVQICREATNFLVTQLWLLPLIVRAPNSAVRQDFEKAGGIIAVQRWVAQRITDLAALSVDLHAAIGSSGRESAKAQELREAIKDRTIGLTVLLRLLPEALKGVRLSEATLAAWRLPPRSGVGARGGATPAAVSQPPPPSSVAALEGTVPADGGTSGAAAAAIEAGSLDWIRAARVDNRVVLEGCLKLLDPFFRLRDRRAASASGTDDDADEQNQLGKAASYRDDRLRRAMNSINAAQMEQRLAHEVATQREDEYQPQLRAGPLPVLVNSGSGPLPGTDASVPLLTVVGSGGRCVIEVVDALSPQFKELMESLNSRPRLPCGLVYDPLALLQL